MRKSLWTQSDTAAPQGHRRIEAKRLLAWFRHNSATYASAENITLVAGSGVRPAYMIAVLEVFLWTVAAY